METNRKEKQLLKQWEGLGCRLMGVSLGDSSSLSSSHPSKPGSVPWVLGPPEGWQLSQGLAHKSLVFLWQPDLFREFLCSLPSLSPGRPECTSISPYWVVCGFLKVASVRISEVQSNGELNSSGEIETISLLVLLGRRLLQRKLEIMAAFEGWFFPNRKLCGIPPHLFRRTCKTCCISNGF